jgi:hypothetical protein
MEVNHGRFLNDSVYLNWPTEKKVALRRWVSLSKSNLEKQYSVNF